MSNDEAWNEALRQIEAEIGRPLTPSERSSVTAAKPGWEKMLADIEANPAAYFAGSVRDFMRKLAARQGTFIPDFDALYRTKAELDRKLLEPTSRPIRPWLRYTLWTTLIAVAVAALFAIGVVVFLRANGPTLR